MSFDTTAKRRYLPATIDSLRSNPLRRSPVNSRYTDRDFTGDLTTSMSRSIIDANHKRESTTIIHPDPYSTYKSPIIEEFGQADRKTKKSPHFFSDYMKDFNPNPKEYKSPSSQNFRIGSLETQARGLVHLSPSYSKGIFSQKDSIPINAARARSPEIISPRGLASQRSRKGYLSPQTLQLQKIVGDENENREKRLKENKKDDIRQRLSYLSEKIYSPGRSVSLLERRKSELPDEVLERAFTKESNIPGKDSSPFLTQENLDNVDDKGESDYKANAQVAIETLDAKYQVMVQEYENNMENLKSHLEKVEQDNTMIVNKLREEIATSQEQIIRHRLESLSKNGDESGNFGLNYDLEEQLRQERTKTRQLETKLEDTKTFYERKLADLNREVEKLKLEKDKKNDEISNLLKSKTQSQRDIITKIKTENEAIIRKLREEHNSNFKDFHGQLERKNFELEKVQREKGELQNIVNEKAYTLQDLTKSHQETYNKLNQTIVFKDNEIEKLSRMVNEAKKGYSTVNTRAETLERERTRLEEENERLQAKAARLEKMIYGKEKESSPRFG